MVISRQLLIDMAVMLTKFESDVTKSIAHYILDKIQPRVISFEEQVAAIRQHLAGIYEREEQWKEAANVLVSFDDIERT